MVLWPLILAAPFASAAASVEPTHGVAPALLARYAAAADGSWTCLSGAARIPFAAVNDDYCDCPDGSDEPGACGIPTDLRA
jgi:protein kinase C substrate 80K-H